VWEVERVFLGFVGFVVEVDFFVGVVGDVYLLVAVLVLVDEYDVVFGVLVDCTVGIRSGIRWVEVVFADLG